MNVMHRNLINIRVQSGMTLLEVLLSIVILSVAVVGAGVKIGNGVKTTANNELYITVGEVSGQVMEFVYTSHLSGPATLKDTLNNFSTKMSLFASNAYATGVSEYTISILSAIDFNGDNILTTDVAEFDPPFTIAYKLVSKSDANISFETIQVLP